MGNNPAKVYFFEEIDNGIHPSRLRLLIDLIEGQTKKNEVQVVTTTHSPELLSMIGDETFDHTSVVFKPPFENSSTVSQLNALPNAKGMRQRWRLGELHAAGWFEDLITFGAGSELDDEAF